MIYITKQENEYLINQIGTKRWIEINRNMKNKRIEAGVEMMKKYNHLPYITIYVDK